MKASTQNEEGGGKKKLKLLLRVTFLLCCVTPADDAPTSICRKGVDCRPEHMSRWNDNTHTHHTYEVFVLFISCCEEVSQSKHFSSTNTQIQTHTHKHPQHMVCICTFVSECCKR